MVPQLDVLYTKARDRNGNTSGVPAARDMEEHVALAYVRVRKVFFGKIMNTCNIFGLLLQKAITRCVKSCMGDDIIYVDVSNVIKQKVLDAMYPVVAEPCGLTSDQWCVVSVTHFLLFLHRPNSFSSLIDSLIFLVQAGRPSTNRSLRGCVCFFSR
jgi:hypothetical protein